MLSKIKILFKNGTITQKSRMAINYSTKKKNKSWNEGKYFKPLKTLV